MEKKNGTGNDNDNDTEAGIKIPIQAGIKNKLKIPNEKYKKQMFDPLDDLSQDEYRECSTRAIKKTNEIHDRELALAKSDITIRNQNYALVTFVGPTQNQKTENSTHGLKIWGCFDTLGNAQEHAKILNKSVENKFYDILVLELYEWALIPPDYSKIGNTEYSDNKLNQIIKTHVAQKLKQKEVFDLRKQKLMSNPDINKLIKEDEDQGGGNGGKGPDEYLGTQDDNGAGASASAGARIQLDTSVDPRDFQNYREEENNSELAKQIFNSEPLPKFTIDEETETS